MEKEKILTLIKEKGVWFVFAVVILTGFLFRLLLIQLPLWYDEGCSWLAASKSFPFGINDFLFNKDFQHTPLYFYYLHFWMKLFGQSDIALRLSSLIPSFFVLPLVYIVARQISDRTTALIAMFIASTSVFQIFYASEVRMYPFAILFSLLSINALLRYITDFKVKQLAEMVVYNTILAYLMIGAPVFILAEIICLLSYLSQKNKSEVKKVLVSFGAFLVLLIPYFILLAKYYAIRHDFLVVHSADLAFINIIGVLQKFISQYISNAVFWVTTQPYIIGTKEFIMFLIPLFVMLFAIYRAVIKKDEKIKLITSIALITFLVFILTAQFKVIVLSPRYLIYISPLLLILAAVGISTFDKKKAALFLAFWFFAGIVYLFGERDVVDYKKNSLFAPVQYIKSIDMRPTDLVIMPFGSSVIGHYLDGNSPKVLDFEAIQEFRNTENAKIYSPEQQQLIKLRGKSRMFSEIIYPDTNISQNFVDYITSYLSAVPKDGQVLVIITGTDRITVTNEDEYKAYFSNLKNPEKNLMTSFMVEFNHSLFKIMSKDFEVVSTVNSDLQLYILCKKVK